jgi:hypothetical protein
MSRILIPFLDLEALGGKQDRDPWGCSPECNECPTGPAICDCNACPYLLPESGPLVLRALWRHKERDRDGVPLDRRYPLGVLDVPRLMLAYNSMNKKNEWTLQFGGIVRDGSFSHDETCDPCEVLAAIVKDEAVRARGGS